MTSDPRVDTHAPALSRPRTAAAGSKIAGSYFLTHRVGAVKARELFFTAEVISGQQTFNYRKFNNSYPGARRPESGVVGR